MDYDISSPMSIIGSTVAVLLTTGLGLRKYLKQEKFSDVNRDSAVNGIAANDAVLKNLVAEVDRLSQRVSVLEKHVDDLTDKLANIRLIALDCYQLANECTCGPRERLLEHLKQIIKDA